MRALTLALFIFGVLSPLVCAQSFTNTNVTIWPSDTEPGMIDGRFSFGWGEHYIAYEPGMTYTRAFVFLPGSMGKPKWVTYIVNAAAKQGYLGIGLAYGNERAVGDLCGGSSIATQDCQMAARLEALTGVQLSSVVSINETNSVEHRLQRLLEYLPTSVIALNTSNLLDASTGKPIWNRLTVAGHSQGAGTAQVWASIRPLHRIVMFAGSVTVNTATYPMHNYTAASQMYGFQHVLDSNTLAVWESVLQFGSLGGPALNIDGLNATVISAATQHAYLTNVSTTNPHGCIISDRDVPLDGNGDPVFLPVWSHMMGRGSDVVPTTNNGTVSSSSPAATVSALGSLYAILF